MMDDITVSKREELRAWLDEQRGAGGEEPLSGTLVLAELVRDLLARVCELEEQATPPRAQQQEAVKAEYTYPPEKVYTPTQIDKYPSSDSPYIPTEPSFSETDQYPSYPNIDEQPAVEPDEPIEPAKPSKKSGKHNS